MAVRCNLELIGNPAPVLGNAMSLGMSGAMAPLTSKKCVVLMQN